MTEPHHPLEDVTAEQLRERKLQATSLLLGATIAISDQQWQQPSRLPGWTRAHVATHLALGATALARLARGVLAGIPEPAYEHPSDDEIERGSERTGLALQIDLDTSAGNLNETLDEFGCELWRRTVRVASGRTMPARLIPAARLSEVTLHHVDLDVGYSCADVPDDIAGWLLEWQLSPLAGRASAADVRLATPDGLRLGDGSREVGGSRQDLLAWLTGRPVAGSVVDLATGEEL